MYFLNIFVAKLCHLTVNLNKVGIKQGSENKDALVYIENQRTN